MFSAGINGVTLLLEDDADDADEARWRTGLE
jgi:hypothetical protein